MLARIRVWVRVWTLMVGWLALGSASGQPSRAINARPDAAPDAVSGTLSAESRSLAQWIDVPFVPQTTDGCGSATLAMVIRYWQRTRREPMTADAAAIQRQLFDRHAHGIYASRMAAYLRQVGFAAYAFHGEWNDLAHHVALGRPLIVALRDDGGAHRTQRGPLRDHAALHYVVVVGASADAVLVNDPARQQRLRLERDGFLKAWSATDDWTLLAVPQKASAGAS